MSEILLIDDDPDIRETLKDVLEQFGVKVKIFENGNTALENLKHIAKDPPLILLDSEMPEMDGDTFIERLHELELLEKIPIVLISADPTDSFRSKDMICQHLQKPLDLVKLIEVVQHYVHINHTKTLKSNFIGSTSTL